MGGVQSPNVSILQPPGAGPPHTRTYPLTVAGRLEECVD
jgi:hypothetical protein